MAVGGGGAAGRFWICKQMSKLSAVGRPPLARYCAHGFGVYGTKPLRNRGKERKRTQLFVHRQQVCDGTIAPRSKGEVCGYLPHGRGDLVFVDVLHRLLQHRVEAALERRKIGVPSGADADGIERRVLAEFHLGRDSGCQARLDQPAMQAASRASLGSSGRLASRQHAVERKQRRELWSRCGWRVDHELATIGAYVAVGRSENQT